MVRFDPLHEICAVHENPVRGEDQRRLGDLMQVKLSEIQARYKLRTQNASILPGEYRTIMARV
jgi:hypothetical protein